MKYSKEHLKQTELEIDNLIRKNDFASPEDLGIKELANTAIFAIQADLDDHAIIYLKRIVNKINSLSLNYESANSTEDIF